MDGLPSGLHKDVEEIPRCTAEFHAKLQDLDVKIGALKNKIHEKAFLILRNEHMFNHEAKVKAAKELEDWNQQMLEMSQTKVDLSDEMLKYMDGKCHKIESFAKTLHETLIQQEANEKEMEVAEQEKTNQKKNKKKKGKKNGRRH